MIHTAAMRFFVVLISLCFLASYPAYADKRQELKRIESDLLEQQKNQKNYQTQQASIEKKLNAVRGQLIDLTNDIQTHEKALLKVEEKRNQTLEKVADTKQKLEGQRGALAELIMALQRLNRMPPQALLARPSAPIDTARSFHLLQNVMPTVSAQAKEVKDILDELAELQKTQDTQFADLKKEQDELAHKRGALEKIVSQRQALLKETQKNQDKAAQKATALAGQAKDLRDLLASLERVEPAAIVPVNRPLASVGATLKSWLGGSSKLPVSGTVKMGYGQSMPGGGISKGISIQAASGAIVTAPKDGVIRFAGPFRQYKLLVIIQHSNGEHSLLGGLQELYTKTGDRVTSGEPIGKLSGDSTQSASLYYERRRNGKPIDPRSAKG